MAENNGQEPEFKIEEVERAPDKPQESYLPAKEKPLIQKTEKDEPQQEENPGFKVDPINGKRTGREYKPFERKRPWHFFGNVGEVGKRLGEWGKEQIFEKWKRNLIVLGGVSVGLAIAFCRNTIGLTGILEGEAEAFESLRDENLVVARRLLREWGMLDKIPEADQTKVGEMINWGEVVVEDLISRQSSPASFVDNFVAIGDGLESERKNRYEDLGINPQTYPGRDMDVVLESPQDWYLYMRVTMEKLNEAIVAGRIQGVDPETGDGLSNYLTRLYGDDVNVREASYLTESFYRANFTGIPLSSATAQRLKTFVEEVLGREWRSLGGETSMIEQVAELAGVDVGGVLEVTELLRGEAKYAPDQTVALARANDGLE